MQAPIKSLFAQIRFQYPMEAPLFPGFFFFFLLQKHVPFEDSWIRPCSIQLVCPSYDTKEYFDMWINR